MGKAFSLCVSPANIRQPLETRLSLDLGKHLAISAEDMFLATVEVGLIS